ncbi:MAG: HAD-IIIC family phosphatase, partial [Verrucomicrobia bacterium]|nr:HAD-IIIC family phosphatase [Verrucomicrobiota bacterium]
MPAADHRSIDDLVRSEPQNRLDRSGLAFYFRVSANFTAEPLRPSLEFWSRRLGWPDATISFSPYNHLIQELLMPGNDSAASTPGANLFLVRVEDWGRNAAESDRRRVIEAAATEWLAAFASFQARASRASLVFVARPSSAGGSAKAVDPFLGDLTESLAASLRGLRAVVVLDHDELARLYPVDLVEDAEADREWHIPFSTAYWNVLGTLLMRRVRPLFQPPRKVIAVDADQTLWDGVVGESGASHIVLGPGRLRLQRLLKSRQQSGMLLALLSKNQEADALAAFGRTEMRLKRSDFVAWRVNWRSKSENLRELAAELDLGVDSFVFIDDNPVECAEVEARCPGVSVLHIPADADAAARRLEHFWALDLPPATESDRDRTEQYRQIAERKQSRASAASFSEFIAGLQLQVSFAPLSATSLDRAAQLTQRTNQFNTTTVRRTSAELKSWIEQPGHAALLARATDRFGDYGEVGLAVFQRDGRDLVVESFLLSCRALGKGVEHAMLARLGKEALESGLDALAIRFNATDRNEPVASFLRGLGAFAGSDGVFRVSALEASRLTFAPDSTSFVEEVFLGKRAATTSVAQAGSCDFQAIAEALDTEPAVRRAMRRTLLRERGLSSETYAAPQTELERRLVSLCEEALRVAPIGVEDDFFELGGDSVQAAQIVSRISAELGVRLSLSQLFQSPCVVGLAALLRDASLGSDREAVPRAAEEVLSLAQERMAFLDEFIPRREAYNICVGLRITGLLDFGAWERAMAAVVERHEPLRTAVEFREGLRVARLDRQPACRVDRVQVPDEETAMERVKEAARAPFSLAQTPLLRCRVVSVGDREHFCLWTAHHMAADGWSMSVLLREWSAAYVAAAQGGRPAWTALTRRYSDYAAWQRERLGAGRCAEDLAYWLRQLANPPGSLELPTDKPRPAVLSYEGALEFRTVPASTRASVETLARTERATPFAVLMATFQALLHRYTGQTDVLVGTPVWGRSHPVFEELAGCFVNTVVVRNEVAGETAFRDQVRRVRLTAMEALAHEGLPFEQLVEALQLGRDLSRTPLFQVMLVFQNTPAIGLSIEGLKTEPLRAHNGGAKFDLVLEVTPGPEGYALGLEYNTSLFCPATAARILEHFENLLSAGCRTPEAAL